MKPYPVERVPTIMISRAAAVVPLVFGLCFHGAASAGEARAAEGDFASGLQRLLSQPYLPPDFDQEVFDELWTTWEEPLRSRAAAAPVEERRLMAMERYGMLPRPNDPARPMQYVVGPDGRWAMNCLACHQGQVGGRMIPGLPNSNYALETLTEEVRLVKVRQRKAFGHMDMGSLLLPLGTTNGTTNAVMFGVALMRHRDADLNIVTRPPRFDLVHHDMDAPPWWHYSKRKTLYADGFAPKSHRMLMQFLLVKENGPEKFQEWEDGFRDIEAWIESLKAPRWPHAIDAAVAREGEQVFRRNCAECHGTYGPDGSYPDRVIPIDEVGTDRVRLDSLTAQERADLNGSWFGHHGRDAEGARDRESPAGYVAPPLDGIWASAPYFHNGSVPTLWHVLHPAARPVIWKRTPAGYDEQHVGLEIEAAEEMPPGRLIAAERRRWFDTRQPGKSASGHDFPDALTDAEKKAVLEYLKQL
ncbi:MAG: c-type cytochrome [Planctomycetota bacterium]|jgi:mono/diheme cytochrome c family protein|nr:c-type cytochrome [Planctomycetota bacterium]